MYRGGVCTVLVSYTHLFIRPSMHCVCVTVCLTRIHPPINPRHQTKIPSQRPATANPGAQGRGGEVAGREAAQWDCYRYFFKEGSKVG